MPVEMILGWFVFGFATAAVLLYGPVMAKACLLRVKANLELQRATEKARETAQMLGKYVGYEKEVADALRKEGQATQELLDAAVDYGKLQDKYIALLTEHKELLEKHQALSGRPKGGVEGTA